MTALILIFALYSITYQYCRSYTFTFTFTFYDLLASNRPT